MYYRKCLSPLGEKQMAVMAFSSDYETIATQLEETGELLQILRNKEEFPSEHFLYIRDPLERIMENVT